MNNSEKDIQKQFKEILLNVYTVGNEAEDMNLSKFIEVIKQQLVTLIVKVN